MKALKNYRYWILAVLGIVAIIGIFSECDDIVGLLATKIVGALAAWKGYTLCDKWEKDDKIPEITNILED